MKQASYEAILKKALAILAFPLRGDSGTIYQPLRSGRIWHKVNF